MSVRIEDIKAVIEIQAAWTQYSTSAHFLLKSDYWQLDDLVLNEERTLRWWACPSLPLGSLISLGRCNQRHDYALYYSWGKPEPSSQGI